MVCRSAYIYDVRCRSLRVRGFSVCSCFQRMFMRKSDIHCAHNRTLNCVSPARAIGFGSFGETIDDALHTHTIQYGSSRSSILLRRRVLPKSLATGGGMAGTLDRLRCTTIRNIRPKGVVVELLYDVSVCVCVYVRVVDTSP